MRMAAWVKCIDSQERTIFLNLDAATSMILLERTSLTRITFTGTENAVEVKETPDYLIKTAGIPFR